MEYLRMKTEDGIENENENRKIMSQDWKEMKNSVNKLASDTVKLGGLGLGTSLLQWLAVISAIYLLVLDKTNWKTNILTALLVPYIFFTLPWLLFSFLRGQIGMWIAFVTVVLRLFFPRQFPEWLELPGSVILIIAVAPDLVAGYVRDTWIGAAVCLVIAGYLFQEHVRASGGFKNAFSKSNGISNTVGIVLLLVYPLWDLITSFL